MRLNYLAPAWNTMHPNWQEFLTKTCWPDLIKIDQQLGLLAQHHRIFPPPELIFRALSLAPTQLKVVILGQDPYHGPQEANGLAFAVNPGIKTPPSLRNIFKELQNEYNPLLVKLDSSLLESWAKQGVMLLNASLSVIQDQANSLANLGWHEITNHIISQISQVHQHCVFLLWGNFARNKKTLINPVRHLILETTHPSPLSASRGFFGCNHFRQANEYLIQHNILPIDWLSD